MILYKKTKIDGVKNMEYFFNQKIARNMSLLLNTVFLCMHIFFFTFFSYYNVKIMESFNIFSIIFYFSGFLLIGKKKLATYVNLMGLEVIVHMILAVICLGIGYGFEMCLISIVAIFFYAEYFSLKVNSGKSNVSGSLLSMLSLTSYISLIFAMNARKPLYVINDKVRLFMCVAMSLITFLVLIISLKLMTLFFLKSEARLSKQAEYDALTGLPNRHYILQHLNRILEKNEADGYWLAMVDIDNFKSINDTYGHNFGDKALKSLAGILSDEKHDITVCRWGGEEFLIIGRLMEASRPPFEKIDAIRKQVEEYELIFEVENKRVPLTVTIGAAVYSKEATIEDWVSIADKRLYVGKYNGKNRVVC